MEKAAKYSELLEGGRCQLVVVGIETGGRWSSEAADFVEMMAQAKAREAPQVLQWSVLLSWRRRWMRIMSLSCARAFATCLVSNVDAWTGTDGFVPDLVDLFREGLIWRDWQLTFLRKKKTLPPRHPCQTSCRNVRRCIAQRLHVAQSEDREATSGTNEEVDLREDALERCRQETLATSPKTRAAMKATLCRNQCHCRQGVGDGTLQTFD